MSDPLAPAAPSTRKAPIRSIRAYSIDGLIVLVFAALGRSTHAESVDVFGVIETALPFLVALLVASLALRTLRRPYAIWPTGIGVWIGTWALGMGIRTLVGGGTALPFVLVALGVLGAGMLGWRLLARFITLDRQAIENAQN